MDVESLVSILIPLLVLVVLWTLVRHWILPFVLGFALAVALGPSARPLIADAWGAVASFGDRIFGRDREPAGFGPRERYPDEPGGTRYD